METLISLLEGAPSGVYRYAGRTASTELLRHAARAGRQGWLLNAASVDGKPAFLAAAAQALRFPAYVGRNWDAFEEAITDLAWQPAPGYLLILESPFAFAARAPHEWQTAQAILRDAAADWQARGRSFHVLLRRTYGSAPDTPLLTG